MPRHLSNCCRENLSVRLENRRPQKELTCLPVRYHSRLRIDGFYGNLAQSGGVGPKNAGSKRRVTNFRLSVRFEGVPVSNPKNASKAENRPLGVHTIIRVRKTRKFLSKVFFLGHRHRAFERFLSHPREC